MTYVFWDPSLETGDPIIDAQHRSLFEMVNAVHETVAEDGRPADVEEVIFRLVRYTATHFVDEEAYMERAGYPSLPEHRATHEVLTRETDSLSQRWQDGGDIAPVTVAIFLYDWLGDHIAKDDKRMVAWVREHAREMVSGEPAEKFDPWGNPRGQWKKL